MAAKQGFLMYNSKGDAIGTKVSVRYRRSGRLSEVVVKRGSTVFILVVEDKIEPPWPYRYIVYIKTPQVSKYYTYSLSSSSSAH